MDTAAVAQAMDTSAGVITGSSLLITASVLIALCVMFNTLASAIKNWRELRKPAEAAGEHVKKCLDADKDRLNAQEKRINMLEEGQRVLCTGMVALLEHELHNGNANQMQEASRDITRYLINK